MQKQINLNGKTVNLTFNQFAPQANGSVLVQQDNTVILATVVAGGLDETKDYFPLSVDFMDKLYSGGQIKGGKWSKRDQSGSDEQVLSSRLIDRSLRPLFPKGFVNEVQVIVTLMSNDKQADVIVLGFLAAAAALAVSDIPFNGPVSAVRIAQDSAGQLVVNPSYPQLKQSKMDLLVCTSPAGVNMIEADGQMIDNPTMYQAISLAKTTSDTINAQIEQIAKEIGKKKFEFTPALASPELAAEVEQVISADIDAFIAEGKDGAHVAGQDALTDKVKKHFQDRVKSGEVNFNYVLSALDALIEKKLVASTLAGHRYDKRAIDQVRELTIQPGILPATHGSALFQRGLTQAITTVSLNSLDEKLSLQDSFGESYKRYIHFYSAMPFSSGEVGRTGRPGRREVGHGALAEKALLAVLPTETEFPYTIILTSEVLSQNGSSSMASTCGSTMALCDAGVPIKDKVAGISTGMMSTSDDTFVLLTDIAGVEDHYGDMDFKITGTKTGITAIQLDIKRAGLTLEMVKQTLDRSLAARLQILEKMDQALGAPRPELATNAPKIITIQLPEDKIGEVIGSGGKTVKGMAAKYDVKIDINDTGLCAIISADMTKVNACKEQIEAMIKEVKPGEEYEGVVMRVEAYGAFVEFLPGREALLHVSEMAMGFVKEASSLIKVGDKLKVKIAGFNDNHQIKLSAPEFKAKNKGEARPMDASRPFTGPPRRPEASFAGERHSTSTPQFANFQPSPAGMRKPPVKS